MKTTIKKETAASFAKRYDCDIEFVDLIDKNYPSNWTREEIALLHTNVLIGKKVVKTTIALNGTFKKMYEIVSIDLRELKCGTVRAHIKIDGVNHPTIFFIRKGTNTLGGVTLKGLLEGKETTKVPYNVVQVN